MWEKILGGIWFGKSNIKDFSSYLVRNDNVGKEENSLITKPVGCQNKFGMTVV